MITSREKSKCKLCGYRDKSMNYIISQSEYIKPKIYNKELNKVCSLRGDRDGTVNHIITELSKLSEKVFQDKTHLCWKVYTVGIEGLKRYKEK